MDFYKNPKWIEKRNRILRRDGYMSRLAKRYGKMKPAEIVHHVFPRSEYPEYSLEDWNLLSVTKAEHNRLHHRDTDELTEEGVELLRRIARTNNIPIPAKYIKTMKRKSKYEQRS